MVNMNMVMWAGKNAVAEKKITALLLLPEWHKQPEEKLLHVFARKWTLFCKNWTHPPLTRDAPPHNEELLHLTPTGIIFLHSFFSFPSKMPNKLSCGLALPAPPLQLPGIICRSAVGGVSILKKKKKVLRWWGQVVTEHNTMFHKFGAIDETWRQLYSFALDNYLLFFNTGQTKKKKSRV